MEAVRRFFRVFDEGSIFKWIAVCLLVLQGLVLLVVTLRTSYYLVRTLGDVTFLLGAATVVLVLAMLLAMVLALVVIGLRGVYEVATQQAEQYSTLALCAKLLRVDGEAALFYLLPLAPAGCIVTWLSSADLIRALPFSTIYSASGTFLLGVAVLVSGVFWALVLVFLAYLLAEILGLIPTIAADVAAIRAAKAAKK
jgi:hypothetical protein